MYSYLVNVALTKMKLNLLTSPGFYSQNTVLFFSAKVVYSLNINPGKTCKQVIRSSELNERIIEMKSR